MKNQFAKIVAVLMVLAMAVSCFGLCVSAADADVVLLGDVNLNGEVTISDATLIQKALAKLATLDEVQTAAADATEDGEVNIKDTTMIQKWLAKFEDANQNIGKPIDFGGNSDDPVVPPVDPSTDDETTPDEPATDDIATPDEPATDDEATTDEPATEDEATTDEPATDDEATTDEPTTDDDATPDEPATDDEATTDEATKDEATTDEPAVDPSDPVDPEDPEDPSDPVDPEDPEDPSDPVDPEDPVDPSTKDEATTDEATTDEATTDEATTDEATADEVAYYLVGYINGADYGIEADWANLGEYVFVNGTVTVEFAETSYVLVKDANLTGYWTNGWLGEVTEVVLGEFGGNNNKVQVSAGTHTFTWDAATCTLTVA